MLTAHNAFDGGDASLAFASPATVVAVVDHHADEGRHADARDREIDAACGSCCTMLAERLLARGGEPPARLLALAFAAVAVDCRGFAAKHAGLKFSPRDVALGHAVLDALGGGPAPDGSAPALRGRALPAACAVLGAATVGDLAKRLLAARKDVSALDAPQLLRLDYKQASAGRLRVGAASIMAPLSDFSRRAGGGGPLGAALRAFANGPQKSHDDSEHSETLPSFVSAERWSKHVENLTTSKRAEKEQLALKTASCRARQKGTEAALRQKERAGERLTAVDHETLLIERDRRLDRLESRNAELRRLSGVAARAADALAKRKVELEARSSENQFLKADMAAKRAMLLSFDVLMVAVQAEHRKMAKISKDLHLSLIHI